jgi:hypothetical protein
MPKALNHRLETFLDFFLPRRRDACQGPSMKRIECGEDFEPAFLVAELASHFK